MKWILFRGTVGTIAPRHFARHAVDAFVTHLCEIQRGDFWMARSYLREAVFYADVSLSLFHHFKPYERYNGVDNVKKRST